MNKMILFRSIWIVCHLYLFGQLWTFQIICCSKRLELTFWNSIEWAILIGGCDWKWSLVQNLSLIILANNILTLNKRKWIQTIFSMFLKTEYLSFSHSAPISNQRSTLSCSSLACFLLLPINLLRLLNVHSGYHWLG